MGVFVCKFLMIRRGKLKGFIFGCLDIVHFLDLVVKRRRLQWKTLEGSRQKKRRTSFSSIIQVKKKLFYGGEPEPLKALHSRSFKSETCLQGTTKSWFSYLLAKGTFFFRKIPKIRVQLLERRSFSLLLHLDTIVADAVDISSLGVTCFKICNEESSLT